jgi:hypothetical protein
MSNAGGPMTKKAAAKAKTDRAPAVVTTIRLDPAVKAALEKAAADDRRTASAMAQKIIEYWLKANGKLS